MKKEKYSKIIGKDESENMEWKPSLSQINEIVETVSALSNKKGGRIVIGVSGSGKILGVKIGKDTIERLTNKIVGNTDPKVYPRISIEKIEGKKIILIEVKESADKLVLAFGRPFKRVGKSTVRMSKAEYERLILEEHKERLQFDKQICKRATLKDLDKEKMRWFLRTAREERNYDVDPKISTKEALEKLNLLQNKKLLNTAVLLFGKNPQRFFLQAKIRCARFKGTEGLDFIDMKILEGTLPQLRERAMKSIMEHIKHGVFFDANRRYDKWEYPLRALEEVLTNALAHRDYFSNAEIQLSIYDDRIEVWNPGELPSPLTPRDLKRKHKSIPRNKLLADKLFLIKYIEQWGTGTNRVMEEMKENGLPEPEFHNLSGGFEVTLIGPGKSFEEKIEQEKLHILDINRRQRKAIKYLKAKNIISRKDYMELNKVSNKTAFLELNDLVAKDILIKQGKGRATVYKLKR